MASISGSNRVVPTVTNTVFELVCELFIGIVYLFNVGFLVYFTYRIR
jgi:hypothetical protein